MLDCKATMLGCIEKLPRINQRLLAKLLAHLSKVAAMAHVNKMKHSNLGVVFGPTLLRPPAEVRAVPC